MTTNRMHNLDKKSSPIERFFIFRSDQKISAQILV